MYNIGWICPKCGRVIAPTTMECPYCNKNIDNKNKNDEGAQKCHTAIDDCLCEKEKKEDNVISSGFKNYKIIFDDILNKYIIREL